jgi:probable F420-dependent oxidoreductase
MRMEASVPTTDAGVPASARRRPASPGDETRPWSIPPATLDEMGQDEPMAHEHKFRFAAQLSTTPDGTARSWAEQARRCEALGYSTLLMPDHFGDQLAPIPALAAVAGATTSLRMGSLVFGNDYRHPVVLAMEAATLDVLSDGRFELSLGAGWMRTDYEEAGIAYDTPRVRVERFEEAVLVLQGLLRGDGAFSFDGSYYQVRDLTLRPRPVQTPGPPLIIGGGGKRVLSFAAQHADIVSINVNLREGTGGPETAPDASPDRTREKVSWVKEAAGERFGELELNALIGFVMITDDATGVAEAMAPHFGISPGDALHVPLALLGTLDEMTEELQWRRQEYGISYWSIEADSWEALGPVVAKLSGT